MLMEKARILLDVLTIIADAVLIAAVVRRWRR